MDKIFITGGSGLLGSNILFNSKERFQAIGTFLDNPVDFQYISPRVYKSLLFYYTDVYDVVLTTDEQFVKICKQWYRRYTNESSAKLVFMKHDDGFRETLETYKQKVKKDGFLAIVHPNDVNVHPDGMVLKDRIILEYPSSIL